MSVIGNGKYGSEISCHHRKQKSYQKVMWPCPRDKDMLEKESPLTKEGQLKHREE